MPDIFEQFDRNLYKIVDATKIQTSEIDPANLGAGSFISTIIQNVGVLASGKIEFTNDDAGYILGVDEGIAKFYIGDSSNYLNWTGSSLVISGNITATTGTIGGFTIGSTQITATGFEINSSAPGAGTAMIFLSPGATYTEDAILVQYAGLISPLAIINNTADATPTSANASIWIDTNKSVPSIYIDHNSDAAASAGEAMIVADQSDNDHGIELRKLGTGAGDAINIDNDGTGKSIQIKQDGAGNGIFIDNNASQEAIYIDQTNINTLNPAIYIDYSTGGNGSAIKIVSASNNDDTSSDILVSSFKNGRILDLTAGYTLNANYVIKVSNAGSGPTATSATNIFQNTNTSNSDSIIYLDSANNSGAGLPIIKTASNSDVATIRMVPCTSDPTAAAVVGDLACVGGKLKICTTAGTPGTWTIVGTQT